ncbi:Peptidoglycan endopeptidase RipA precursor (plasmid) [Mycobacterium sp. THAF192]|nr:Peptidoglycan endopeptidase RipA precursor [Mycobacterium sp. THAF192]
MTAEPFLNAMDDLYGSAPRQGGSAGPLVRSLPGVAVPAGWHSGAADELGERTRMLTNTSTDFAEADDATKQRVDATGAAVADGKRQMGDIKDDYRTNRSRLAAAGGDPEVAARINELDRVRTQDGANTVRATQARLPMMRGGGMPMMPSGAGMPMMPSGGMPSMGAPMQAFSPLSQMLSGLTIPQQVTRPLSELADNTPTSNTTGADVGPGSAHGRKIAELALSKRGTPYVWGGGNANGPTGGGFDCSGLTQWATYQATGILLPRTTYDQVGVGTTVSAGSAQAGDLVLSNWQGGRPEHVGIALGDGNVVHAPQRGDVVKVSPMPSNVVVKRVA